MNQETAARQLLAQEARALLTRLARIKPFALHEAMVPAAALSPAAQRGLEHYLAAGRKQYRGQVQQFLHWLHSPAGRKAKPAEAQRRFTLLRLRFNAVLSQFDIFADAITQRSEHETGVWLAGLDALACDALALPGYYQPPPVICYLDRGGGAAIRRARTRLPGGGENPVAIIRVPRERMVGSGIASSLVHEVGHQAAALLDLVNSMRVLLQQRRQRDKHSVWSYFERWISEILADFWSVAHIGIGSTLGLIGVVSLPRPFVFRVSLDDPHPIPWIRVKLSCAIGQALYPHPQWQRLAQAWEALYPKTGLTADKQAFLARIEAGIPAFIDVLIGHRPNALRGRSLAEVMALEQRQPERLQALYQQWQASSASLYRTPPTLVFAAIGQAKADGKISPEQESRMLGKLLTQWALRSAFDSADGRTTAAKAA